MSDIKYTILTEQLCQPVADLLELCFPYLAYDYQDHLEFLEEAIKVFPEGTIVALEGDKVVGMGAGIFIEINFNKLPATEDELLEKDGESRHKAGGGYYYGTDMAVDPDYRGRGIGRAIYNRRKALIKQHNKKGFVAAALLPGFVNHKDEVDIHQYVSKVVAGELFDPTLSVQLRNGFKVIRLLHKFFISPRSDDWSALIYWENPDLSAH